MLKVTGTRRVPGGAANTAANVVSLGGHATLVALVGDDDTGIRLRRCAVEAGVNFLPVKHGRGTLRKTRVIGQQQQIVRLDYEDVGEPDLALERLILAQFDRALKGSDIVVISDYAKGFLSESVCQAMIMRAHAAGCMVVIDPRPQHREFYVGCDYLTPNWRESRALLRLPDAEPSPANVSAVRRSIASELRTNVVLTLGAHGISFCSRDHGAVCPANSRARSVRCQRCW